jgi:hypothetical protein
MKELQKTVFYAAYDSVVFSSGRSMTEKEQKGLLRASIIGSDQDDQMTLPEQMVLGFNQFSYPYDEVLEIDANGDRNAQRYDKKLKDFFFPQESYGEKLAIHANSPDGITKALLNAKYLSNPVNVSLSKIMRGMKKVLRNGRNALACAKEAESNSKDGCLSAGQSIADYHRYIHE